MSKQRPDAAKLSNELAGASAFFRPASRSASTEPEPAAANSLSSSTPEAIANSDVTTSRRHSVTTSAAPPSAAGFDLNRPTTSRDSLRLSLDETRALDDLRQSLKWDYDLSVSKNDICRAALHLLLEDWTAKGDRSAAIARLKRKQISR